MAINEQVTNPSRSPVIILVRGLPGSGKSYITKQLSRVIEQQIDQPVVMLDPDAIDFTSEDYQAHQQQLTDEGIDPALHAYRFLRGQAYDAITSRGVVIWNQPFTNLEIFNKMVARFHEQAALANVELSIVVIEVMIDPAIAKQRVDERKAAGGHGPSNATFERFVHDFTSFTPHGYRTIQIDGAADTADSVATIMRDLLHVLR